MTEEQLYTLMTDLSRYYPVGIEIPAEGYPGYLKWQEVTAGKINEIQLSGESAWRDFAGIFQSRNKFENNDPDCSFWQFPSYSLRLDLGRRTENAIERVQTFCVDISLLANAYTIFLEERITLTDVSNGATTGRNPTFIVVANKTIVNETYKACMDLAQQEMPNFFPKHQFLGHFSLFNFKVSAGAPYHSGLLAAGPCSIYDYLFSPSYQKSVGVKVLT